MTKKFKPGDRVRLTGDFLRSTGQYTGSEGLARWTVQACACTLCASSIVVAVDESHYENPDYQRHVAASNLERCR